MATYKHLRSGTANKRPTTSIADGQLAINTNTASPGLFFKDSAGTGIVKVGPVHVGTTAPNSSPAVGGSTGNYLGEQWLDTSVSPAQMKVWSGSTWVGVVADELPVSKLQDGAARQLIQTDAAGTGVEWTSNVDVPGTLDVTSTATFDSIAQHPLGTAAAPTITFTGDTNTGVYSPGTDQVAFTAGGTEGIRVKTTELVINEAGANYDFRIEGDTKTNLVFVDASTDRVGINTSTPSDLVHIYDTSGTTSLRLSNNSGGSQNSNQIFFESQLFNKTASITHSANSSSNSLQIGGVTNLTYDSDSHLFRSASGTNRLHIDSFGSLYLAGTSGNSLSIDGAAPANRFTASGGNIGIGIQPTNGVPVYIVSSTGPSIGMGANNPGYVGFVFGIQYAADEHFFLYSTLGVPYYEMLITGPNSVPENVFNNAGANIDFRIEGDNNSNLFFADASTDRIGIGTASPLAATHITSTSAGTGSIALRLENNSATAGTETILQFAANNGNSTTRGAQISGLLESTNGTNLLFYTNPNSASPLERCRITSAGRLGLGTTASISPNAPLDDFHIASTDPAVLLEETDAGTDEKFWRIRADGSILRFEGINDAFNATAAWLNVTRSTGARTADNIAFSTGTSERVRIDSSGRLLVGTSTALASQVFGSAYTPALQVVAETTSGAALTRFRADAGATYLALQKGRGTIASPAAVIANDSLGGCIWSGYDASNFINGASITAEVDGTPGTNDMPGRLVFSTTADGAASPTERLRITSAGNVGIGTSAPGALLHLSSATGSASPTPTELRIATSTVGSDWSVTDPWGRISFYNADGSASGPKIHAAIDATSLTSAGGTSDLVFRTNNNLSDTLEARMVIKGDSSAAGARVGIGVTSPGGTLDIKAAATLTPLIVQGPSSEFARIDSSGRLLVGTTSAITTVSNGLTSTSQISLAGTTTSTANIGTSIFVNNASAASSLSLSKSRNTVVGSHAILVSNDRIGSISYSGSDGTNFIEAARISCDVDGTLGQTAGTFTIGQTYRILTTGTTDFTLIGAANSNPGTTFTATGAGTGTGTAINTAGDMPGRLVFSTSADNSGTPTERLRITSAGLVGIGTSSPDSTLNVRAGANNTTAEEIASFSRPDAAVRAAISKGLISGTTNGIALGTTTNHPFALNTNGAERLYITNAGNVGIGTTSPGGTLDIKAAASTAPLIVQGPSNEFARIDSSGRLLIGSTLARANFSNSTLTPQLQVEATTTSSSSIALIANGSASASNPIPIVLLGRSRGTFGTNVLVSSGDALGSLSFQGNDGSEFVDAAYIRAFVDGTAAADVMPGRLAFFTTADGASSPTERLRITNDGVMCYDQAAPVSYAAAATLVIGDLKNGLIQYTGGAATLTLPTGTLTEDGFSGVYINMTFEWSVINTGSGTCTIGDGTGHTVTGSRTVAAGASGRFASRRTAANTFVSYRLS